MMSSHRKEVVKVSKGIIDRLYDSMINDLEYKDLPETEKARNQLRSQVMGNSGADDEEAYKQWMSLEKPVEALACANEYQGFVYGFRHAMGLFMDSGHIYGRDRLEENIHCEYSTLAVDAIDKVDKSVDILKQHLPEKEFSETVDTMCASLSDVKYAAFEQGFLRGIAVAKAGSI